MSEFEMRHPESELLLPYLDGELPYAKVRQVERHLKACWQCRSELQNLQLTVSECVRYSQEGLGRALPEPPARWSDLSREFDGVDAAARPAPRASRWYLRWAVLGAGSAALVAASLSFRLIEFHAPAAPTRAAAIPAANEPATPISSPAPVLSSRVPAATGAAPGKSQVPVEASLSEELQAVAALHHVGADLGDPVEVGREHGRVVVRGSGISAVRQQQIREALSPLPNLEVQFAAPVALPAQDLQAESHEPVAAPPHSSSPLESQFPGRSQFENFSAQLLEHQETAMSRVYALRRLALEFPAEAETQLTPENQALLRSLSREHLDALSRELTSINSAIRPVLSPGRSGAPILPEPVSVSTWQAAAENLYLSARQEDTLLAGVLGAAAAVPDPANLPQKILAALAEIRRAVQQCELLLTM